MSSLFNYIGYRYQRNPHRMAKYLGANQWEILNIIYTGSVTTVGGGKPTVGREYPAFCQDPDSWRGWAVLVRRESRVLRRTLEAARAWYWYSGLADFARSNASLNTDQPFDFSSVVRQPIPVGGPFARFAESNRVIVDDTNMRLGIPFFPEEPSSTKVWWSYVGSAALEALGLSDGSFDDWFSGEYGEEGDRTHNISSAQRESICIVGELIYPEILYGIETETATLIDEEEGEYEYSYEYTTRRILFAISTIPPASPALEPETVWWLRTDNLSEGGRDRSEDIVVTGGRAVVICGDYETEIWHVDALTGEDLKRVDLSEVEQGQNSLDILQPCVDSRWQPTFVHADSDDQLIIGGKGLPLMRIDLTTNAVVWSRGNEEESLVPINFAGGSLICARETRELVTVTDYRLDADPRYYWTENPVASPVARTPTLGPGLSHRAGIAAINPVTGATIGASEFSGVVDNGTTRGSIEEYVVDVELPSWVSRPWQENPYYDPDNVPIFGSQYSGGGFRECPALGIREVFCGLEREEYSNVTESYIEGPSTPGVTGDFPYAPAPYVTASNLLAVPETGGSTAANSDARDWENSVEIATQVAINDRSRRTDEDPLDFVAGVLRAAVTGEKSRRNPDDWIRGERWRTRKVCTLLARDGGGNHTIPSGTMELSGYTDTKFSRRALNQPYGPGYDYLIREEPSVNFLPIPVDEIKPPFGSLVLGFVPPNDIYKVAAEYARDHLDWGGTGDKPYWNLAAWWGDPAPVDSTTYWTHRIWWVTAGEVQPRTKTATPALTVGPTCSTGSAVVLGPRLVSGEPLRWQAYGADGSLVWERAISKEATITGVGIPIALAIEGGIGIFTFYSTATPLRHLCVLDGATGEILHDAPLPADVSAAILQPYYGDGVIWASNYSVGVAPGEEG